MAAAAAIVAALAFTAPLGKLQRSSPVVLDRHGVWLRAMPVEDGRWRLRADLDRTDPVFVRRLIALEDSHFWLHPGVDPMALARAAASDLKAGRVRSGGSTLTMQLARRLEPRPRTLGAKAIEAARAVGLEARLGKRGVLAAYLTLAPYGGSLEGVRAASLAYFGHEPATLTDAEQALLIAIPQAPELRRPDRHPKAARRARAVVLPRRAQKGLISATAAREAAAEPLPRRAVFPERAWAAAGELARAASPSQPTVVSTIDAPLQARVEALAAQTGAGQGLQSSAAIVVVEPSTRAVRAIVSSAGRDRPGGWVDATRALRSPGSSLKPFIYAFAFEQGLAAPQTRLADAPLAF
ncbi:MAG: transglycosylase domain-containing protein, partial [Caulobacteraceae bacterium]